jgi:hypothetical protein
MGDDSELLLYSLNEFREIIRRCLDIVRPERLVEVGGEAGHFSRTLVDWSDELQFEVLVVEPYPSPALRNLAAGKNLRLIEGKSPEALLPAGPCDVYLLDGDHNFETLAGELEALVDVCGDRPFLALLHDVAWPNARRDMYYRGHDGPSANAGLCLTAGVVPDNSGVTAWGFRGEGDFAIAREEGGVCNGVLSAVEAFLESTDGYRFLRIPCLFGLGLLFPADAPWAPAIEAELSPYHENPLLARMEKNRLTLFFEILRLQDSLAVAKRELELLRSEQEEEIEDLSAELLKMLEALALTTESQNVPSEVDDPGPDGDSTPLENARRVLSYDLYRAQIKARRVGSRIKHNLAGR